MHNRFRKPDFWKDNWSEVALRYIRLLMQQDFVKDALEQAEGWLERLRDLLGDADKMTLEYFGIVGEIYLQRAL